MDPEGEFGPQTLGSRVERTIGVKRETQIQAIQYILPLEETRTG